MVYAKSGATAAVFVSSDGAFASKAVMKWVSIFPAASLGLLIVQPSFITSVSFGIGLAALLALFAYLSVAESDGKNSFESIQLAIGLLAPVQFAFMMWAAVNIGREMVGASLVGSSLVAFAVLTCALLVDALVSAIFLLATSEGTAGASVASLISTKYAGLLGQIH